MKPAETILEAVEAPEGGCAAGGREEWRHRDFRAEGT